MELDRDLASIQQARQLMLAAKGAQAAIGRYSQAQIDALAQAVADACTQKAEVLARMAAEETGFGVAADKTLKNRLASVSAWQHCREMKTVGVIREDRENRIIEVAVPVGVVVALVPSTNPTSTTIFKSIIALKAGNAVVFSPHPGAKNCILETVAVIQNALAAAGAPRELVQCVSTPTVEATNTLMRHEDTGLILATGGPGMVKAAYSSGRPALGVGAGNGPAFIERSADIPLAVKRIFDSKTFDNGTICASEQSIVTELCIAPQVEAELEHQGGHLLPPGDADRVAGLLLRANGSMNPAVVGKSAADIAQMADVPVPAGTRVLLARQTGVSQQNPYSREKLCPVLGYYVEPDWEQACRRCIEILHNEGIGHTMAIHSQNEQIIRAFALEKPVMRLLVNTPAALGGVGATTGLPPSFTLGCGAAGGNATSDNVTPLHLLNIRRVAWGLREAEDLRGEPAEAPATAPMDADFDQNEIERITRQVITQLYSGRQESPVR